MCLINFSEKKIAEEDIIVYKYLKCFYDELYTPYYNALVKIGDTYYSDIYIEDNFFLKDNILIKEKDNAINKALHSFKNYNDTKQVLNHFKNKY